LFTKIPLVAPTCSAFNVLFASLCPDFSAGYVTNTLLVPDRVMALPLLLDSSMVSLDSVVPLAV